jgi:hypothetical protein
MARDICSVGTMTVATFSPSLRVTLDGFAGLREFAMNVAVSGDHSMTSIFSP